MGWGLTRFDSLLAQLEEKYPTAKENVILTGSAVLAARGIRDVCDLDILASKEWFGGEGARLHPAYETPKVGGWCRCVSYKLTDNIQGFIEVNVNRWNCVFPHMRYSLEYLTQEAEYVQGWRVMDPCSWQTMKRVIGRPKDLEDLALWDQYLQKERCFGENDTSAK